MYKKKNYLLLKWLYGTSGITKYANSASDSKGITKHTKWHYILFANHSQGWGLREVADHWVRGSLS